MEVCIHFSQYTLLHFLYTVLPFLYTFLHFLYTLLHLIPVASSCHDVHIFSDHLCANFGDENQNDECHTLDIGRPLFIKEMDVGGDFR